jgi:hypothetical protein
MSLKKKLLLIIAVVPVTWVCFALFCYALVLVFDYSSRRIAANQPLYPERECVQPPESFSESDLIGTWKAGFGVRTDTLVIQADGTYKQFIQMTAFNVDYESEWQQWRLEKSEEGNPHIYLEGLRLCAVFPDSISCDHPGGGEDVIWNDFCQHEGVKMTDEGVLIVLGSSAISQPPRGIRLFLPSIWSENPYAYELQEP